MMEPEPEAESTADATSCATCVDTGRISRFQLADLPVDIWPRIGGLLAVADLGRLVCASRALHNVPRCTAEQHPYYACTRGRPACVLGAAQPWLWTLHDLRLLTPGARVLVSFRWGSLDEQFWSGLADLGIRDGCAPQTAARICDRLRRGAVPTRRGECVLDLDHQITSDAAARLLGTALAILPAPLPYTALYLQAPTIRTLAHGDTGGLGTEGMRRIGAGMRFGFTGGDLRSVRVPGSDWSGASRCTLVCHAGHLCVLSVQT
jgi:hypothetical protein